MVVAALIAAVVASGAQGSHVLGAAVIGPPPGPPSVGDCVVESFSAQLLSFGVIGVGPDGYPQAKLAPCRGSRFGEVAAVLTDPVPPPVPTSSRSIDPQNGEQITTTTWPDDPNAAACAEKAVAYAGVDTAERTQWRSAAQIGTAIVRPTDRQRQAGQHWVACVAAATTNASVAYSTPIRNVYRTGYPAADLISRCGPGDDPFDGIQTSCANAHRTEYFGFADVSTTSTLADLQSSCAAEIARRTAVDDPSMGGSFRVVVSTYYFSVSGYQMGGLRPGGTASCKLEGVAPGRVLDHSLAQLGSRPIPWA